MTFIKPQLAAVPGKQQLPPSSLDGPEWVAEPKLDGERAQIHVAGGRTVAVYSRRGLSLLSQAGLVWMRSVAWPFESAILDAEAYVGEGLLHSTSVDTRRKQGRDVRQSVTVFDILELNGADLKGQTWEIRRKTLEAAFQGVAIEQVTLTPVADSWRTMWKAWVEELGGEGVMVKRRDSKYVPGWRSPAWQKVKVELTVDVVITGTTDRPTYQREGFRSSEAACTYGYWKDGQLVTVGQGIKWGKRADLAQYVGMVAEVKCNGQMEGGALRHARLLRFRDDKPVSECTLTEVAG